MKEISAAKADDDFWGQGAWAEEESDHSFNDDDQSDDGEDIFDSDFDASEPDSDAEDSVPARGVRKPSRRNGKYVDPALKKTRTSAAAPAAKRVKRSSLSASPAPAPERALRKSTKATREKKDSERVKADAEREVRRAKVKHREENKTPEKILTQSEMLAEAEITAKANDVDLQRLLRLEEEKKRPTGQKEVQEGAKMSIRDKGGKVTISFTEGADVRAEMFPQCVVVEAPEVEKAEKA